MDIISWYKKRGFQFVWQRGLNILNRYSIGFNGITSRINESVEAMAELGCAPTFFVPGIIVKRHPQFFHHLQEMGTEIAVHSYQHLNLDHLPLPEAKKQLSRAIQTFELVGIENRGFRCPYLGYSEELLSSMPYGMFDYSSNEAIFWDFLNQNELSHKGRFYNTLEKYYKASNSKENVCVPTIRSNMIEIPICIPDDLQLHDGLHLNVENITRVWSRFLEQTYIRGELFTLIFHTELASFHHNSLTKLIQLATQHSPSIWIATLRDISDWWREKSLFKVDIASNQNELKLNFDCSPRATILIRNLDSYKSELIWDGKYSRLYSNILEIPASPRPFIGIADGIPEKVVSFLRNQGYLLDIGETARLCGLILDKDRFTRLPNDVELVKYIESSPTPLVRYWRWPNGAKSAMSITGDLDALSLMDYVSRLFVS